MILVLKMTDTLYWCLHLSIKHQQTSVNLKWYGVNLEAGTTRWDGSGNKNLCTIQPCCGIFQHGDSCHTALVNLYSNLLILWRDLLHWWHTGITTVLNHGACQLPFEYASLPMEIFSGDCCTALQCFMNYFLLAQPFHSTQTKCAQATCNRHVFVLCGKQVCQRVPVGCAVAPNVCLDADIPSGSTLVHSTEAKATLSHVSLMVLFNGLNFALH